jgi:hypothetical protein
LKEELANYVEERVPYAIDARFTVTGKPSRWVRLQRAISEILSSRSAFKAKYNLVSFKDSAKFLASVEARTQVLGSGRLH